MYRSIFVYPSIFQTPGIRWTSRITSGAVIPGMQTTTSRITFLGTSGPPPPGLADREGVLFLERGVRRADRIVVRLLGVGHSGPDRLVELRVAPLPRTLVPHREKLFGEAAVAEAVE